jgi:hypothetical protein
MDITTPKPKQQQAQLIRLKNIRVKISNSPTLCEFHHTLKNSCARVGVILKISHSSLT